MTPGMINKLLSLPGTASLLVYRTQEDDWCAVVEMKDLRDCAAIGTTPQEALDGLARVMGLTPDIATAFPTSRNTSAGELRRMHEEAEEENT